MLPHPRGEAASIASAFHECFLGLGDLIRDDLDPDARTWIATLEALMGTTGIQDPSGRGTWQIKAETLTEDERFTLSRTVDELAWWFHSHSTDNPSGL
jgi:hypothetical protein